MNDDLCDSVRRLGSLTSVKQFYVLAYEKRVSWEYQRVISERIASYSN